MYWLVWLPIQYSFVPNILFLNFSEGNAHPKLFPELLFMTNMGVGNIFPSCKSFLGAISHQQRIVPLSNRASFPISTGKRKGEGNVSLLEKELFQIFRRYLINVEIYLPLLWKSFSCYKSAFGKGPPYLCNIFTPASATACFLSSHLLYHTSWWFTKQPCSLYCSPRPDNILLLEECSCSSMVGV